MNLYRLLAARAEAGNPLRIGVIGAGKFGSMFLSQAYRTPGMHVVGKGLYPTWHRRRVLPYRHRCLQ